MAKQKNQFGLENAAECSQCVCFNTRMFTRVVTQIYEDAFKKIGFRGTQFTPLVVIFAYGPVTINKLSEYLVMDRTTLGRNIKPLQREGLINIRTGEDRREKHVSLTDKGLNTLIKAFPVWKETQKKILNQIGKSKWKTMLGNIKDLLPRLKDLN